MFSLKLKHVIGIYISAIFTLVLSLPAMSQSTIPEQTEISFSHQKHETKGIKTLTSFTGISINPALNAKVAAKDNNTNITSTTSTSLTAGFITDSYYLKTDDDSNKFKFEGHTSGVMLNSKASSLMLSYGTAEAVENEGKIRSIAANLHVGSNATLVNNLFGLPVGAYIPIRFNMGYRNLHLMDSPKDAKGSANVGSLGVGAGLGASVRIPTGLPLLENNITGFASLTKSVGGMGDLTPNKDLDENRAISGIRLTQNTDFNLEGKFENLLGNNIGVTLGLTLRWLKWTSEGAEELGEVIDVISGKQKNLSLNGTQTFLRLGINW